MRSAYKEEYIERTYKKETSERSEFDNDDEEIYE